MPTLTIKKIPFELYERLKKSAVEHHRSINSEVLFFLEQALRSRRINPETILSRIENLHKQVSLPPLTEEFLQKSKEAGRP